MLEKRRKYLLIIYKVKIIINFSYQAPTTTYFSMFEGNYFHLNESD